jgi:hypothetical protein
MVRILSAALLFAATSASASAIPSFEYTAWQLQSSIAALRTEQLNAKAGNIGPQISNLAWNLERAERETSRLRSELRLLQQRIRRQSSDLSLRWDVQRFTRELAQVTRDMQWRVGDLRHLSAQAEKDEALVAPASRLVGAARWLKSETSWLLSDAHFASFDFERAGFTIESMNLDRDSRDLDWRALDLQTGAEQLLVKVKPLVR